jgi:hypothetical protein
MKWDYKKRGYMGSGKKVLRMYKTTIRQIKEPTLLLKIVTDCDLSELSEYAVTKIKNQKTLRDIASQTIKTEQRAQAEAVRRVRDQKFLKKILLTTEDLWIKQQAISKIKNVEVLKPFLDHDNEYVQKAAAKQIRALESR